MSIVDRIFHVEIVTEAEIAFLFVDGRFERVLPAGRHRLGRGGHVRIERVPLREPRVTFADIDAIKGRDDVRRVTASVHVDERRPPRRAAC